MLMIKVYPLLTRKSLLSLAFFASKDLSIDMDPKRTVASKYTPTLYATIHYGILFQMTVLISNMKPRTQHSFDEIWRRASFHPVGVGAVSTLIMVGPAVSVAICTVD